MKLPQRFSRKKSAPLNPTELGRIGWMIELGLRSGRDWTTTLSWLAQNDRQANIRNYLGDLTRRLKFDSSQQVLQEELRRSSELVWRLFIEILLQADRGSSHLSRLFQRFSQITYSIEKLRRKESTLLFVPKFQSWGAVVMVLSFTLGMPLLAPDHYRSFLTMGRFDLFASGMGLIGLGLLILHFCCAQPRKLLDPLLRTSFFFYFLSMAVESGLDLFTGWKRSVESIGFPEFMTRQLTRQGLEVDRFDEFLQSLQSRLPEPWPSLLAGLCWTRTTGMGLSEYLRTTAEKETDRLLFSWEDQVHKLTMVTLIPLGFLIFPGTLFLVVGPQILEILNA